MSSRGVDACCLVVAARKVEMPVVSLIIYIFICLFMFGDVVVGHRSCSFVVSLLALICPLCCGVALRSRKAERLAAAALARPSEYDTKFCSRNGNPRSSKDAIKLWHLTAWWRCQGYCVSVYVGMHAGVQEWTGSTTLGRKLESGL